MKVKLHHGGLHRIQDILWSLFHLFIYLFIYLFIRSFIHPSIHSFIYLFICLFIYLFLFIILKCESQVSIYGLVVISQQLYCIS